MAWYKWNINLTRNPPYDSPYLRTDQLAGPILPLAFANLLWVLYTIQVFTGRDLTLEYELGSHPNFYKHALLFVDLETLGTFIKS